MPYVHISHSPGQTLDDYRAVADAVGGHTPEGLLFSVQGEETGGLHIVDVWKSKAHADQFAAEELLPAFSRTGRGPDGAATYVTFDTDSFLVAEDLRT